MLRLIFSALIILGLGFGYTNFTKIEDAYYDTTDAILDTSEEITSEAHQKVNDRLDKFVKPAREAYGSAVDERDRLIKRDLDK